MSNGTRVDSLFVGEKSASIARNRCPARGRAIWARMTQSTTHQLLLPNARRCARPLLCGAVAYAPRSSRAEHDDG